jgi:hypothetical protein
MVYIIFQIQQKTYRTNAKEQINVISIIDTAERRQKKRRQRCLLAIIYKIFLF